MTDSWRPLLDGPLVEQAQRAIEDIAAALPQSEAGESGRGASLAGGLAGQSLFYAYLALHGSDDSHAERAAGLLENAVELLAEYPTDPSLYGGFAGVAWTVEHLQGRLFEEEEDGEDPNLDIDEALLTLLERPDWPGEYDLIGGLVGFGVYALERLPRPTAVTCLERVVDRLAECADPRPEGTAWFTPPERLPEWQREYHPKGNYNLGLAHGLPGVIAVLGGICAAGVAVERARPLLDDTVRFLLARKLPPELGSCFATSYHPDEAPASSRLAWCYGDPGVAASLLAAARAVREPAWEAEALATAVSVAERPFEKALIRDAGLCHGSAGLAHLLNRMYQTTGEERLAQAARFWFNWTLQFRQPGEGVAGFRAWSVNPEPIWRSDPGFLEGAAGIGLALLAALSPVEPAWDRTLLVSLPDPKD
jgi:hypothetical protein